MKRFGVQAVLAAAVVTAMSSGTTIAATYLVDAANPTAADTNAGTEFEPWKTIQHAADVAKAGDTVFVAEGKYPEYVTLKNAGTEKQPITFRSTPRRMAQLTGFNAGKTQYIRIEGFHLFRDTQKDGVKSKGGISVANADHVLIADNFIENAAVGIVGGRTLRDETRGHAPEDIHIVHNDIYHSNYGILAAGKDWVIESNELHRLFNYGSDDADYSRAFGERIEFRYNFYHGTKQDEIGKSHVDIVQFFDNNGEYLDGLNIHHNVFTDFHQGLMGEMNKAQGASNLTFARNIYYTADPWGAWGICNKEIPSVTVERNTFYGIQWFGVGIMGQKATGGVIRNNIFQKIEQAIQITQDKKKNETLCEGNILFEIKHKDEHGPADKVDVDPKMVDPAKGNFRLAAGSSAINGGAKSETVGALDYPNVYYVDPGHPAATDEGFGYAGHPFKTAAKAVSVAETGATIMLMPGVYREEIKPAKDGVTLVAETEAVKVSGADLLEGWKKDDGGWYAVLDQAPVKTLCDGEPFQLHYDQTTKRLDFNLPKTNIRRQIDPRLHIMEVVRRAHGLDLSGVKGVKAVNVRVVDTSGDGLVEGTGNSLIFTPPAK